MKIENSKLPLNRANELVQIQKCNVSLPMKGREPTVEELGESLNMDPKMVGDLLAISREMVSLDAPVWRSFKLLGG